MPRSKKNLKTEAFVNGHGDVFEIPTEQAQAWRDKTHKASLSNIEIKETVKELKQYEIDWNKIAANVREALAMVEKPAKFNQTKKVK